LKRVNTEFAASLVHPKDALAEPNEQKTRSRSQHYVSVYVISYLREDSALPGAVDVEEQDFPSAEQCIFDAGVYRKKPTAEAMGSLNGMS